LALALIIAPGLVACSSDESAEEEAAENSQEVALQDVTRSVLLDDLHFAGSSRTVVAAPGGSNRVFRVAVDTRDVTSFEGFGARAASVDEANGLLFVADRDAKLLHVVDVATRRIVSDVPLASTPDYVRYCASTNEVWVTEPGDRRIEVLHFPFAGSPSLARATFIAVGDGPEGLVFDTQRRRAFIHHFSPKLGVIDVDLRVLAASWPTGCSASHGIPILDERRGLVFAGCRGQSRVAVLSSDDGRLLGEKTLGGGDTVLAYSASLGHFYLRGDPGARILVLGVPSSGSPFELGSFVPAEKGHAMAADDRRQLWAADPASGRLLRFVDPYPATP
jgi:hypothetical protein